MRFKVIAILRRVVDPAGDSKADIRPPQFNGEVAVIPQGVLATQANRVSLESAGRASSAADKAGVISGFGDLAGANLSTASIGLLSRWAEFASNISVAQPIPDDVRQKALQEVDRDLVKAGLIDKVGGQLSRQAAAELSFERTTCLPTPAIVVKGCLDECNVCEEALEREIKLDLDRKELENKLLSRQIELLEKSQEYRCCPAGEAEDAGGGG